MGCAAECKNKPFLREQCLYCLSLGHRETNCRLKKAKEMKEREQRRQLQEQQQAQFRETRLQRQTAAVAQHTSWAEGDRVLVNGRHATVTLDLRPEHSYAKVRWEDSGA